MPDYFQMIKQLSRNLPPEADWAVAALTLIDLLETGHNLTDEQRAVIVGIGAMAYRQGFEEMKAGIGAADVMKRLMKGAGSHE